MKPGSPSLCSDSGRLSRTRYAAAQSTRRRCDASDLRTARAFSRFGCRSESKRCYPPARVLRHWRTSVFVLLICSSLWHCLRRATSAILEEQTSGHSQSSENARRNNGRGDRELANQATLANLPILVVVTLHLAQGLRSPQLSPLAALVERSRASSFWKLRWSVLVPAARPRPLALPSSNPPHAVPAGSTLAGNP